MWCAYHTAQYNAENSSFIGHRSRTDRGNQKCSRYDVCEETVRINEPASQVNNYSVGGRMCHMDTRQNYLRELKEKNILIVKWKAGVENSSDMFTKNLPKKEFNKHAAVYVGLDKYMTQL